VVVLSEKRCLNCGASLPMYCKFCSSCGSTNLQIAQFQPFPPPPPPPQVKKVSRKKIWVSIAAVIIVVILLTTILLNPGNIFPFSPQDSPLPTSTTGDDGLGGKGDVTISAGSAIQAAETTVTAEGAMLSVNDPSSPVYGLKIEFPEGAANESINVAVTYADVIEVAGLPENTSVVSKLIKIETTGSADWNENKHFDLPVLVTLPYDSSVDTSENPVRFYCYDRENQILDSAGFIYEDCTGHTVSFYTSSFSEFVGIDWKIHMYYSLTREWGPPEVDTGFTPKQNGWFIPNTGSYIEPYGNCMGMVAYAKWFYRYKTVSNWHDVGGVGGWNLVGPRLNDKYREGDVNQWRDDETAIQLATRAQIATHEIQRRINKNREFYQANASNPNLSESTYVALTWLHGMAVTHEPQLVSLSTRLQEGTVGVGGHAVLTYRYAKGRFDIYDPNFPETPAGTDERQIPYSYSTGFARPYSSGQTAQSSKTQYNVFFALGWKAFATKRFYEDLYAAAENKFSDNSIFPKVTFTTPITTPYGTTPIDTDKDGVRDTSSRRVRISGTISGGKEGQVGDGWVFVSGKKELAMVTGQYPEYSFAVEVDLYHGDNEVIFIGSFDLFRYWAGFKRDVIKCTALREIMVISLTWSPEADLDLHVLEPAIEGVEGRHIYIKHQCTFPPDITTEYLYSDRFQHAYPYWERAVYEGKDYKFGPVYYFVYENMTLPNYQGSGKSVSGTYEVRVSYDNDDDWYDNKTRPVTYYLTARILASIDKTTGAEVWIEQSTSGVLTTDWEVVVGSGDEGRWGWYTTFYADYSWWSPLWTMKLVDPQISTIQIPPPPQNKLPTQ